MAGSEYTVPSMSAHSFPVAPKGLAKTRIVGDYADVTSRIPMGVKGSVPGKELGLSLVWAYVMANHPADG